MHRLHIYDRHSSFLPLGVLFLGATVGEKKRLFSFLVIPSHEEASVYGDAEIMQMGWYHFKDAHGVMQRKQEFCFLGHFFLHFGK